ncbi:iron deficiency-induced protein A [Arenicella chitinivorans]|uniref:Iron deficiency-induced protein A n=1 Tax=Arenicella chitinivorans TaxID=1329800 RepID=A0A918RPD3_9GAMM|nr:Fe(3+) ABC transporter substrate-binding protein [Arenicella chitinivorans]GHA04054.1 iron deficiency-induced protein A [Arenicella chitinivorans]
MKKLVLIALAGLLVSCSSPTPEVNLYSARKEALIKPLLDAFTQETGIKVNIISASADALLERIKSEGINSPADVLLTTDAGRLHRAKQASLFAPIDSAILHNNIPANYRDGDNTWFGLSLRARPIMVTAKAPESTLTSYEDLVAPELAGQICIRSSGNIYNQSLVASMLAHASASDVEAWAKGLVANMAREPQGGDRDQIRAAAAGQCSVVVANTYYLANMLADSATDDDRTAGEAISVIWPNQQDRGTHVNVSGAGLIKSAPNSDNGIKLIEYLSSDKAQHLYANVNFEYPVKPGVDIHPILAKWGKFKADALPLEKLGENNAEAVKLMDRAGWK